MSITDNKQTYDSIANFTFKTWQDQYQLIHHLILYSNVLMVLQGKKCSGKSSYIKSLTSNLPQEFICQSIDSKKLTSVDNLSLYLRQLFSLSTIESEQTATNFDLVNQINQRKKHCLLILDDAHKLPDEVLSELLKCLNNQEGDIYFHCLLVGDQMLSCKFDQAPFATCKDSFTHFIDMPELDVDEARSYLIHKFSSLGTMQVSSLKVEQLESLIEQADGDLIKLTHLAQKLLMGGSPKEEVSSNNQTFLKSLKLKPRNLGIISIFGVCVITVLVMFSSSRSPVNQTRKLVLPSRQAVIKKERFIKEFQDRPSLADTVNLTRKGAAKPKPSYIPLSMIPKHTLLATKVSKDKLIAKPITITTKPQKLAVKKIKIIKKVNSINQGPTIERQLSAIKQARESSLSKSMVVVDSVLAIPVLKASKVVTKTIAVRKFNKSRLKGHLGQGYGMQFVASHKKSALKQYARKYKIYNKAKYYETYSKGKRWYVLVLGDHRTKAQAKRAQSDLPRLLKNKKPWLRSIKGLKRVY